MKADINLLFGARYMLEILMACNLFVVLLKKRKNAALRITVGMFAELLIGVVIGTFFDKITVDPLFFLFWSIYVVLCIPYMWFVCEVTWSEAVYCVVFGFAVQHLSSELYGIIELFLGRSELYNLLYLPVFSCIYLLSFFLFIRKLAEYGRMEVVRKRVTIPVAAVLLITLVLSTEKKMLYDVGNVKLALICQIYDLLCCTFILWGQVVQKEALRWQKEVDYIDYFWHSQQQAYTMTQESIDIINRKCHDLKHQLAVIGEPDNGNTGNSYIKDLEENVMIYDSSIDTGNKVLNTVLMEKTLLCKEHGITLTYLADASKLEFVDVFDLYALFGNVLDNAIESVEKLKDDDMKVISLKVAAKENFILIQTDNYYADTLHFEDDIPVTTKENNGYHGYGMKSIRSIAEKYGGCINIDTDGGIFKLQILIPLSV